MDLQTEMERLMEEHDGLVTLNVRRFVRPYGTSWAANATMWIKDSTAVSGGCPSGVCATPLEALHKAITNLKANMEERP
jgi:hypothetical protein